MKKLKKPLSLILVFTMIVTTFLFANVFTVANAAIMYNVPAPTTITKDKVYAYNSTQYPEDNCEFTYPTEVYINVGESLSELGYTFNVKGRYDKSIAVWSWNRIFVSMAAFGGVSSRGKCDDQSFLAHFSTGTDESAAVTRNFNLTDNWDGDMVIGKDRQKGGAVSSPSDVTFDEVIKLNAVATTTGDFTWSIGNGSTPVYICQYKPTTAEPYKTEFAASKFYDAPGSATQKNMTIRYHVYDKAPLNTAIQNADAIINNTNAIQHRANNYASYVQTRNQVYNNVLLKREVTESQVVAATKMLTDFVFDYPAADYTQLDAAVATANSLNPNNYLDFSGVTNVLNSIDRTVKCDKQYIVDGYLTSLNSAMAALVYKDADYTQYNQAVAAANALDKTDYVSFTAVTNALAVDVSNKKIIDQQIVDNQTAAINTAIHNLVYAPADYTALDAELVTSNKIVTTNYTPETVAAFQAKLNIAKNISRTLTRESKTYIATVTNDLKTARLALTLKTADYTEVNKAVAAFNALDKNAYTTASYNNVKAAVDSVTYGLDITKQTVVTNMANNINTALGKLVLVYASYTAVDTAIAKANALTPSNYVDFSNVTKAVNAVVRNLPPERQSEVDKMASDINTAINALVLKKADYTAVDTAVSAANALNANLYKNFSAVTTAVNAVVRNLDITKQSQVDKMATDINTAINALVYKDADYTALDSEISTSNAIDTSKYTPASVTAFTAKLNAAKAVSRTLNITQQSVVDTAKNNLTAARNALVRNVADYTVLNQKISFYNTIDTSIYTVKTNTPFKTALNDAKNIAPNLPLDQQSVIDAAVTKLDTTYNGLKRLADYSQFDALIARADGIKAAADYNDYTTASKLTFSTALTAAKAVSRDFSVDEQNKVDTAKANLQTGIDSLVLKSADFTALNTEIQTSNAVNKANYTTASVATFTTKLNAAKDVAARTLNIREQSIVDTAKAELTAARLALVEKLGITFVPSGAGKVTVNGTDVTTSTTIKYDTNQTFTATAVANNGSQFMYWTDENGRIISYKSSIDKTAIYSTSYTAVFLTPSQQTEYTVTFIGKNNAVLSIQKVLEGNSAVAPSLPYYSGYTANGWLGDYTCVTSDVVVRANYAAVAQSYTVTAGTGITITGKSVGTNKYDYNTKVAFSLSDYSTFKGWSIDGGNSIICYDKTYTVYVGSNMNVTYVTKQAGEVVTPKPVVAITNVKVEKDTKAHVTVLVERTAPSGKYALVNSGVIYTISNKELTLASADANADVYVKNTTGTLVNGQYLLSITLSSNCTLGYRGYAVYKNLETGEFETVYSAPGSQTVTV